VPSQPPLEGPLLSPHEHRLARAHQRGRDLRRGDRAGAEPVLGQRRLRDGRDRPLPVAGPHRAGPRSGERDREAHPGDALHADHLRRPQRAAGALHALVHHRVRAEEFGNFYRPLTNRSFQKSRRMEQLSASSEPASAKSTLARPQEQIR